MAVDTLIVPLKKVALDIFLLMCVGFPILFIFLWGNPYHRGFFCDDEDLKHPYHESTVPSIYLYIVGIGMNVTVMILIEYLNPTYDNREIICLGRVIPNWIYNAYCVLLVFAFGMACSQLTTDIMKYTVGRYRPHFYTVCLPDVCMKTKVDPNPSKFYLEFTCTNPEYMYNKRIMKEMRLSFPSGHSSFSMFTMLYFAIYLQKRMTWNGSKLLKHTLQFLAVLAAIFTAMTRISDYKHHWSDVLSGLAIGTIVACVTARCFSNLFDNSNYTQNLLKQEVTEMPLQGLNGNRHNV